MFSPQPLSALAFLFFRSFSPSSYWTWPTRGASPHSRVNGNEDTQSLMIPQMIQYDRSLA